jgi:hypothetical protein
MWSEMMAGSRTSARRDEVRERERRSGRRFMVGKWGGGVAGDGRWVGR